MSTYGRRCIANRAEPFFQHDTTSKLDMVTYFTATFPISRSSDIDIGRQDGGGGGAALEGEVVF